MDLTEKMHDLGPRRFLKKSVSLSARWVWRRDYFFWMRRSTAALPCPARRPLATVLVDHESIARFAPDPVCNSKLFRNRVDQGLVGFFHFDPQSGLLHAYQWLAVGGDYFEPYMNWTFRMKPDEAYSFDGYAKPEFRGQTAPVHGMRHVFDYLRERGVNSICAAVDRKNPPAWKFHLHIGFEIESCLRLNKLFQRPLGGREMDHGRLITPEIQAATEKYRAKRERRAGQLATA